MPRLTKPIINEEARSFKGRYLEITEKANFKYLGAAGYLRVEANGDLVLADPLTGGGGGAWGLISGTLSDQVDLQAALDSKIEANTAVALINKTIDGTLNTISNVGGGAITSGTIADSRLSSNITKQGNTFNVASALVQLDSGAKIPLSLIPDGLAGGLEYQGTWNATTGLPTIPAATPANNSHYYKVSVAGNTNVSGITDWEIGDWVISNGVNWEQLRSSDAISTVFGRTGAISAITGDYNADQVDFTPYGVATSSNVQDAIQDVIDNLGTALPSNSNNGTIRYNGSAYVASSVLLTGTDSVGINGNPAGAVASLNVVPDSKEYGIYQLGSPSKSLYTGVAQTGEVLSAYPNNATKAGILIDKNLTLNTNTKSAHIVAATKTGLEQNFISAGSYTSAIGTNYSNLDLLFAVNSAGGVLSKDGFIVSTNVETPANYLKVTGTPTAARVLTLPDATTTLVGTNVTQTLTNKTLGSGTVVNLGTVANGDLYYGNGSGTLTRIPIGSAAQVLTVTGGVPTWAAVAGTGNVNGAVSSLQYQMAMFSDTTGKAITPFTGTGLPHFNNGIIDAVYNTIGSPLTDVAGQIVQNKTIDNTNTITVKDTLFTLQDNADTTKQVKFELSSIGTATTRTFTFPNASGTFVTDSSTNTFTNKTIDGTVNTLSNIAPGSIATSASARFVTDTEKATWNGKADAVHTHAAADVTSGVFNTARLGTGTANSSTYLRGDGAWATITSGVSSFNSRTGAVVPASGDYTFAQISSTPTTISGYGITDAVSLTGVQNISNKSISASTLNIAVTDLTLTAATSKTAQFALSQSNSTARTFTLPDISTVLVGQNTANTLSNKLMDNTNSYYLKDTVTAFQNAADSTKQAYFDLVNIPTSTARTYTFPSASGTLTTDAGTSTLTNKTISGASNTITNISLTSSVTGTLPIANGGTGQTTANAAFNALVPSQTGNSGKYLTTDGTNTSWAAVSGGGSSTLLYRMSIAENWTSNNTTIRTLSALTPTLAINSIYYFKLQLQIEPYTVGTQQLKIQAVLGGGANIEAADIDVRGYDNTFTKNATRYHSVHTYNNFQNAEITIPLSDNTTGATYGGVVLIEGLLTTSSSTPTFRWDVRPSVGAAGAYSIKAGSCFLLVKQ